MYLSEAVTRVQQDGKAQQTKTSSTFNRKWTSTRARVFPRLDCEPMNEPTKSETESDTGCPSGLSMRSNDSMFRLIEFKHKAESLDGRSDTGWPSGLSMRSNDSMFQPIDFKLKAESLDESVNEESSQVRNSGSNTERETHLDSIFMRLENNMKKELKKIRKLLSADSLVLSENEDGEDGSISESFLRMTLNFLKRMKQEELAEHLWSRTAASRCQQEIKCTMKKRFQHILEGVSKGEESTLLNDIYTKLHITKGVAAEVNKEHEVIQIERASRRADRAETSIEPEDLFKASPERSPSIKTVLTLGVAGIGKTVLTRKFTLDWTENKSNQHIHFTFPFSFRELNLLKDKKFSLVGLVHHFFTQTKEAGLCSFEDLQVVFIFDGLDEYRLPLDFKTTETLTDVTQSTSVEVLLINLIRGQLLPSARLWITTRPAAANQIPPEYVDMVTEVRGFTDQQKEEYFRKKFKEKEQASRIISHVKMSQSLHIMCHIPVFCWINASVLDKKLKKGKEAELPKTLTQMYIHHLAVQARVKKVKYDGGASTDLPWNLENKKMIMTLGKLAFQELQKGNLFFYESDLTEADIKIKDASVYSGIFSEFFQEECGIYYDKFFCFIHLSFQEFLAALYVHQTFVDSGNNLLDKKQITIQESTQTFNLQHLHQSAVDEALQSPNGHLDLFLRFLFGLSLPTNQSLLRGLMTQTESSSQTNQETIQYIKKKLNENPPAERSFNLFHCLNELNDDSLVEVIQKWLTSGRLSTDKLTPTEWSALAFILVSSQDLTVFELKKYCASEEALLRLLPAVEASNKAVLNCCGLSEKSCRALSSVLGSQSSSLTHLDLSNNDLRDSGVKILSAGLENTHCKLEALSLSGCLVTEEGCASLVSALSSKSSHLKELDLSYNHPGDSVVEKLFAAVKDPDCSLVTLRLDYCGEQTLKPGLRKYFSKLEVDTNSIHQNLQLSNNNMMVTYVEKEQLHPDHPDRFDFWRPQLLCSQVLTGRCYWEVEWSGHVFISVSYRGIRRKGDDGKCLFGGNHQSWSLECSDTGYSVRHHSIKTTISSHLVSSSDRVGVFVDHPAGTLSFFRVSSDSLIHLYTFNATFTEPLYAGFTLWSSGCSMRLCPL